uniref:Uncharacterized protein n=1 Tax=Maylandia zebra TaxID=106582 RepID=A0A3P9B8I8_9CICH
AMASLRALLGVVLCSSWFLLLPQADFDLQSCCKWCLTAVCSHFKWFAVTKPTGSPAMVEPTEDGLKVASSDTCWKMETLATKTDVPGNFPVSTPTKTGNSLATPDEYGLNHSINTGRSETFVENRLYGNVAFSFTALLADGILPENVLHLPKTRTFTLVLKFYIKTA